MSTHYVLSLPATDDIEQIIDYIAEDNLIAAIAFERDVFEAFDRLVTHPKVGHIKQGVAAPPMRFWIFRKRYLIAYRTGEPLEIVRVLSGYQNLVNIFDPDHPDR